MVFQWEWSYSDRLIVGVTHFLWELWEWEFTSPSLFLPLERIFFDIEASHLPTSRPVGFHWWSQKILVVGVG